MIPRIPAAIPFDRDTEITKCLNSALYHGVHCRPYSEYRHNIVLKPLFQSPKTNIFNVLSMSIRLPASGRWFLYTVDCNEVVSIKFPESHTAWTCFGNYKDTKGVWHEGYCSTSGVDVRFVIGLNSRCLPRHVIWMIRNPKQNNFIIAIGEDAMMQISGSSTSAPPTVSLNIYFHNSSETFSVVGYSNTKLSDRNAFFQDCLASSEIQKIIFINGIEVEPKNLEDVFQGSYGEIVYDSSVAVKFTVDFKRNGDLTYKSTEGLFYTLIHIPKSYNQDNDILNHQVCDIYVHPDSTNTRNYTDGFYINRLKTEALFLTLTHNDFAIAEELITKYISMMGLENTCQLKIYVRNHHKGFRLDRDPNYLMELYQLDDAYIINNLLENTSNECWYAKNLANGKWQYLMDHYMEGITATDMPEFIEALGYLNAANTVDSRVKHILISENLQKKFYIPIPICYNETQNLKCHVFINGRLLDNDNFKYEKIRQFLVIDIIGNIELTVGSRLTVELFEDETYYGNTYTLTPGNSVTIATDQEYIVYKTVELTSSNTVKEKYIYNRFSYNVSWKKLLTSEMTSYVTEEYDEDSGMNLVTIKNKSSVPMTFLVTSTHGYSKIYGVERHLKELNYDIWCSHLLTQKVTPYNEVIDGEIQEPDGEIVSIPYINTDNSLLVYLNGRELIEGLDYSIHTIKTNRNCIVGQFVILQNVDYLQMLSNTFEVFCVNEVPVTLNTGFLTTNITDTVKSRLAYLNNLALLFIDGEAQQTTSDKNYFINVDELSRKGACYKIRAFIPRCLKTIFDQYSSIDTETLNKVADYVESFYSTTTEVTPISRSHHIYSTFFQTITEQIIRKKLQYDLRWSDDRIKLSLQKYEDMMEFDIGLSENNIEITDKNEFVKAPSSGIDFRFVDVLPSYRLERIEDSDITIREKRPLMLVSGSRLTLVNGNYICMNPGIEYMKSKTADHINNNAWKIWENQNGCYIEHVVASEYNYWCIHSPEGDELYKAQDNKGIIDIWNLDWVPVKESYGSLTIKSVYVEVNTVNEFPNNRLQFTYTISEYAYLMRVAKLYLKTDLAKDGMNI